ncbi:GM19020 [Drosophila sechellia]|uniref:GM19020 n=1 Tax=Drosophila sechellia TaxID=7238 RepID=B4I965_DROSE|nr:GM19020 [Drosophila sechellia]
MNCSASCNALCGVGTPRPNLQRLVSYVEPQEDDEEDMVVWCRANLDFACSLSEMRIRCGEAATYHRTLGDVDLAPHPLLSRRDKLMNICQKVCSASEGKPIPADMEVAWQNHSSIDCLDLRKVRAEMNFADQKVAKNLVDRVEVHHKPLQTEEAERRKLTMVKANSARNLTIAKETLAGKCTIDKATSARNLTIDKATSTRKLTFDKENSAKILIIDKATSARNLSFDKANSARNLTIDKATSARKLTIDKATSARKWTIDNATSARRSYIPKRYVSGYISKRKSVGKTESLSRGAYMPDLELNRAIGLSASQPFRGQHCLVDSQEKDRTQMPNSRTSTSGRKSDGTSTPSWRIARTGANQNTEAESSDSFDSSNSFESSSLVNDSQEDHELSTAAGLTAAFIRRHMLFHLLASRFGRRYLR